MELDIAAVARRSGVPASTLRYYEEKGLIASIGRHGLKRVFDAAVLEHLALIALGRAAGFSLEEIARMFSADGTPHIDRQLLNAKADELAVPPRLIRQNGAVSEPVARAMAEGALRASGAAVAVSITGFAGKAGPHDEPGLVHFALAAEGSPTIHKEHHFGDIGRGPVRLECLRVAMRLLHDAVTNR